MEQITLLQFLKKILLLTGLRLTLSLINVVGTKIGYEYM